MVFHKTLAQKSQNKPKGLTFLSFLELPFYALDKLMQRVYISKDYVLGNHQSDHKTKKKNTNGLKMETHNLAGAQL